MSESEENLPELPEIKKDGGLLPVLRGQRQQVRYLRPKDLGRSSYLAGSSETETSRQLYHFTPTMKLMDAGPYARLIRKV